MFLSDAIRIGSALKPQGFGSLWPGDGSSCAMGAAFDALTLQGASFSEMHYGSFEGGGRVYHHHVKCHICGHEPNCYEYAWIPHLNDTHKWSREAIADEVERIEIELGLRPAKKAEPEVVSKPLHELIEAC